MKKLLLIVIFTVIFVFVPYSVKFIFAELSDSPSTWRSINSPVTSTIYSIYFIDDNTGFIGSEGTIYKTVNQGRTWYQVYSGDNFINKMSFHKGIGFASCYDVVNNDHGKLLKTENEGETWEENTLIHVDGFVDVEMKNELEINVVSFDGYYFSSNDGGVSWSPMCIWFPGLIICGLEEFNNQMFALNPGYLYKQDSTGNWFPISHIGIYSYGDLVIDPHSNSLYAGGDNWGATSAAISSTPDEGGRWEVEELGDDGAVRSLIFCKNSEYDSYAFGEITVDNVNYSCIWQRKDATWTKVYTFPCQNWFGLMSSCESKNYVYAAGGGGMILRKIKSTASIKETTIAKKIVSQNYPNPFNPVTKIKYHLPKNSEVILKVFDMSGKEVATLVNKKQTAGTYEVTFDGTRLSSGTYFYRLQAGEFIETKRMMLIK